MANYLVFNDDQGASLAAIKAQMQTSGVGVTTDDAIKASTLIACEKVEELCGPVLTATCTDRVPAGSIGVLSCRPASLTSIVTRSGVTLTVGDFEFDGQLLTRVDEQPWSERLTVTYTAGWARGSLPGWASEAAVLIAIQHRRGKMIAGPGRAVPEGSGFLIPNQARELIEGHELAPGGFA